MKFARVFIIGFAILLITSISFAFAEWTYTAPKLVDDTVLTDEINDFLSNQLRALFPGLSESQKQQISISAIYEYPDHTGWSVELAYKDCPNHLMCIETVQTADGSFQITECLPWPLDELITAYDSSISYADALAIARIHLADAIYRALRAEEPEIVQIVEQYGYASLDPSRFTVDAAFETSQNGGVKYQFPEWCFYFGFTIDESAGDDWNVNPLWFNVYIDASSGSVLAETYYHCLSPLNPVLVHQ